MGRGQGPAPGEEARANPGCHLPPTLPTPTLVKDYRYVINQLEDTIMFTIHAWQFGSLVRSTAKVNPGSNKKQISGVESGQ